MSVKNAVSVDSIFRSARPSMSMPDAIRGSTLGLSDARQMADAMASVAPHGALDNTQVDLNGGRLVDLPERETTNPRSLPLSRYFARFNDYYAGLPDKTQQVPDAYIPSADKVWLPSGNPGVMAHELGHAIDLNGYPNTTPRMMLAGAYARLAPHIWQEHAAWRKGEKALLQGSAEKDLDPNATINAIEQIRRGKRYGLTSYYGAGAGGLLGLAGGVATALSMGSDVPARARGNIAALGGLIGSGVGGLGGLMLGRAWGGSKSLGNDAYRQKYINRYAKVLAEQHGITLDEATAYINSRMKPKSDKPAQAEGKKPMKKSASIELPESVEEAAILLQTVKTAGVAARRNGRSLVKQAAGTLMDSLSGMGTQLKDYWGKLDPKAQNTLIGTGLGAGGGMLASLADEGNNFGLSALTGAAMGGLGTAAHQYLPGLATKTTSPVDDPKDRKGFEIAARDTDTDFANKLEDNAGTIPRAVYEAASIVPDVIGQSAGTDVANMQVGDRLSRSGGALLRGAMTGEGMAHIGTGVAAETAAKLWRDRANLHNPAATKLLNDNVAANPATTTNNSNGTTSTHMSPAAIAARRAQQIVANKGTGPLGIAGMARHYVSGGDVSRQILNAAAAGGAARPRSGLGRVVGTGVRQGVIGLLTHLALRQLRAD